MHFVWMADWALGGQLADLLPCLFPEDPDVKVSSASLLPVEELVDRAFDPHMAAAALHNDDPLETVSHKVLQNFDDDRAPGLE